MRVRGSLSITKDLTLPNPGGTTSKGLVALSDAEGNLQWGNFDTSIGLKFNVSR
jgi:hypothetical protein